MIKTASYVNYISDQIRSWKSLLKVFYFLKNQVLKVNNKNKKIKNIYLSMEDFFKIKYFTSINFNKEHLILMSLIKKLYEKSAFKNITYKFYFID